MDTGRVGKSGALWGPGVGPPPRPSPHLPPLRASEIFRLLVAGAVVGAVGLIATWVVLDTSGGKWWGFLVPVVAGVVTAVIGRRAWAYWGAVGGALIVVVAWFAWGVMTYGLDPFAILALPVIVVVTLLTILLGWYPVTLTIRRREEGKKAWLAPVAAGIVLVGAIILVRTLFFPWLMA